MFLIYNVYHPSNCKNEYTVLVHTLLYNGTHSNVEVSKYFLIGLLNYSFVYFETEVKYSSNKIVQNVIIRYKN